MFVHILSDLMGSSQSVSLCHVYNRMRIPAPGAVLFDPGIPRPVAVLLSWLELGKWGNPARGDTGFRTDCTGGAGLT